MKTYSELMKLKTFKDRYRYLKIGSTVGDTTFGFDRYLNQRFYTSEEWRRVRDAVIVRDNGCDLGIEDREIQGQILVHHLNPITQDDLVHNIDLVLDPEFLICVSLATHNAIHYGDESQLDSDELVVRRPNDTCLWR